MMKPMLWVGLLALAACSPRTVNTVQPGAVRKTALEGEWFWRRTVADVPYGTAATFSGASDQLDRIRWRIEEDHLLGYRSYPNVDDAGASGLEADGFYGAPLLVYRVERHFDIRRGYNRTTGEESNVIEENVERPWYEREHLRVDWSRNLADVGFSFAGLDATVLGFSTGDDRSDVAPRFDDSDGDGTVDSLMIEQKTMLAPQTTFLPGFGDIPVCLFYGRAHHECAATEVDVVQSFVRTDQRATQLGLAYDDRYMETFGYFSTQRLAYDRAYGLVEPNRTRWANRHPLFERTIQIDDQGRLLCRANRQTAPCSEFTADDEPTPLEIPVLERTVRPVVYHAGPDFPEDLKQTMQEVAAEWNVPLQDAVNGLRYWGCLEDGGRPNACADTVLTDLDMFVFCPNNPSVEGDPELCSTDHTGPDGVPDGIPDPVRVGDLRYHVAHVFDEAHISSPYGYGPSAADPVGSTVDLADGRRLNLGAGEIVSGTAYVYGYVLDRVSHQVADLVMLLNGELEPDAFIDGENVAAWVDATRKGTSVAGSSYGVPEVWSESQVAERLDEISNGLAAHLGPLHATPRPTSPAAFQAFMDKADRVLQQSAATGAGQAAAHAALDDLIDSPFTDLLWTPDTIGMHGHEPTGPTPDGSPLDMLDPDVLAEEEAGLVLAGQHAVDLDDGAFSDSSLLGLAQHYASLGWSHDEIVEDVRKQSFRQVMLHEVGHTLGLRHNFAGSFDALNYQPEYWDLRTADGTPEPRHVDPLSPAEIEGRIHEYEYSSIMDYPGARNVGWAGLGHYDKAAVKFGYAGLVEVFTDVPETAVVEGLPNRTALAYLSTYNHSNVYPSVLLWYNSGEMLQLHYTQFEAIAGDLEARTDVPLSRLAPTLSEDGTFSEGLEVAETRGGLVEGMPAVPYRFCSDEFALGITCARFDRGADPYEAHQFLVERYFNDYLLNNFARQRYGFGSAGPYVSRLYRRTFQPLRTWQRYYALFHGLFDADGDPNAATYFAADRGFGGWTAATDGTLRFLTQVVARPEPGQHGLATRPDGTMVLSPDETGVDIPIIAGAYYESEWDFDSGYHWFERQVRVGSYFDRMLALFTLTNTASNGFLGIDTAIDPRRFAIGFQDLYRDDLQRYLGQLGADDVAHLAPARQPDGTLVYPDPLRTDVEWPPAGTDLVQPAAYWLVRFDATLFGKALLNAGYDRSFLNRSRLYVVGTGDAPTPGPGQAVVSFTDPVSGKTWEAWSFPELDDAGDPVLDSEGELVELGASARLVRRAQHLASRCISDVAACGELERVTSDLDLQVQINRFMDGR